MNKCIDCKQTISKWGIRCHSCAKKYYWKMNPKAKKQYYCKCGNKLSDYRSKLCFLCSHSSKNNNYWLNKKRPMHSKLMTKIMKGRILTDSWKLKISKTCIKKGTAEGKNNPMFGKKRSKIERKNISLSLGGTGIPHERCNYPSGFYEIREFIRKRDNCICQLCNKKGRDVHHIDYCIYNNNEYNLIILCEKCNCRVNINRDYWYAYFMYIIENKDK